MVSENQPDWLPPDWVEVKDKREGKVLCYRNTETGQTFFTKEDVVRYINMVNISNSPPQPMDEDNDLDTVSKTVVMKSIKVPEWLPRGWTMELRSRDSGPPLIKCFVHPEGKRRFYSKPQVFRYLETVNSSPTTQEESNVVNETGGNYSPDSVASQRDRIPEWLPQGWTMEMKVGGGGTSEGRKYKCYIAPGSGHKCYSKPQVYDYLKTLNSSPAGQERERVDQLSGDKCSSELAVSGDCKSISIKRSITKPKKADDNRLSLENYKVIEMGSVDGLPPGWIKEVRSKKIGSRMRTDPYFIDPLSGYEFRSKPDALRYLETGDIKSCAIKPKRRESKGTELMISKDSAPLSAADTQELAHSPIRKELFPDGIESSKEGQNKIKNCAYGPQRVVINDTACIIDTESIKDDISVVERASVDGLPPGWIKEVRSKKVGSQMRRDPTSTPVTFTEKCLWQLLHSSNEWQSDEIYYIDPLSGYEFRSKPDALRYLETGEIKNCAIKPKRRELLPGGLAVPESESSKENAIAASKNCPNGTVSEKHPKPGDSDSAAKASSAENVSVTTAATDILACGTVENSGSRTGTRLNKSKNKTATPLPSGRSSKRLRGAEPEIKSDPLFSERAIRSATRGMPKEPEAEPESEKIEGEKPANDLAIQEVVPGIERANEPNGEKTEGKEPELLFPFGESLGLDPCLEFAVKTLTGAIPVEDNLVNQGVSPQPWP